MIAVGPNLLRAAALACSVTVLGGCDDDIDDIREQGALIFLTRNAATTYYEGRDALEGPEYDLAAAFAAHLGVKPKVLVLDTVAEILEAVSDGRGHVAAAGLTITEEREKIFRFGPPYKEVRQELVCHRDGPRPETVKDLVGLRMAVIADSSYQEALQRLSLDVSGLLGRSRPTSIPRSCCNASPTETSTAPSRTPTSSPSISAIIPSWSPAFP